MKDFGRLGLGLYLEDLEVGNKFRTAGRTLLESDLSTYINLTWFTEDLFCNQDDTAANAIKGRPVPAGLIFTFSEGLIVTSLQRAGLAFLNFDLDVKGPTVVGDTIYVHCEVIESRPTSKNRGLVRTRNTVKNQRGETVLVYNPLRLVKNRAYDAAVAAGAG